MKKLLAALLLAAALPALADGDAKAGAAAVSQRS